ncbi:hypothetical protein GOODEAATRI_004658, partial [Goodea atripinnis]
QAGLNCHSIQKIRMFTLRRQLNVNIRTKQKSNGFYDAGNSPDSGPSSSDTGGTTYSAPVGLSAQKAFSLLIKLYHVSNKFLLKLSDLCSVCCRRKIRNRDEPFLPPVAVSLMSCSFQFFSTACLMTGPLHIWSERGPNTSIPLRDQCEVLLRSLLAIYY